MIKKYTQFISENFDLPNEDEVKEVEEYLSDKYPIQDDSPFGEFIIIDDKQYFIKNKRSYLTNKILNDIGENLPNYTESSIRKAIKNHLK